MTRPLIALVGVAALLGACASSSDKVAATYVSPIQYSSLNCQQIA